MDGGASWLANTGCSVCDLNCHPLSGQHAIVHQVAISIGLDCGAGADDSAVEARDAQHPVLSPRFDEQTVIRWRGLPLLIA
jgi:hypothetical protein